MRKSIGVFCGSSSGNNPRFKLAASQLGISIAQAGYRLVYGGGNNGLMCVVADAILQHGGEVVGVMPHHIARYNVIHKGVEKMVMVDNMYERKEIMLQESDLFIALPGGYGTLDELFEVLTAVQLEQMNKPVALLNIDGYFDGILQFLQHAVECDMLSKEHLSCLMVKNDPQTILLEMIDAR